MFFTVFTLNASGHSMPVVLRLWIWAPTNEYKLGVHVATWGVCVCMVLVCGGLPHVVWDVVLNMFLNFNQKLKALNILSAIKKHHSLPFIQVKTSWKDEYGPKILRYTIRRGFNALTIQIFVFKCTKSHKHQLVFILTINWNSPYIQELRLSFRIDPYVSHLLTIVLLHHYSSHHVIS